MNRLSILLLLSIVFVTGNLGAQTKPKLTAINFLVSGQEVDSTAFADVTVELQFDMDMDSTEIPQVKFGLLEPYSLTVPEGSGWLTRRLWQGFFTVSNSNPNTGDGLYLFQIMDAKNGSGVVMDTTLSSAPGLGKSLFICRSGKLELSTTALDFGTIRLGENKNLSFTVSNIAPDVATCAGCLDLNVTGIGVSGSASFYRNAGSPSVFTLAPGQSQVVNIVFDPLDRDDFAGTATVSSDDGSASANTVDFEGTAIGARIALIADSPLNFGKVEVGFDSTRTIRLTNVAADVPGHDENLIIGSISTSSAVYSVDPASTTIAPGDTQDVAVKFTPADRLVYNSKLLTITHNDLTQSNRTLTLNGNANDESPPSALTNLSATWSGYGGYVRSGALPICWDNPNDPSGIAEVWWKFSTTATAPVSANDTTANGGRIVLAPGATCANLQLLGRLTSGYWYCYVWLVDGSGNSGYANAVQTAFVYDINSPGVPAISGRSIPASSWFTSSSNFKLTFTIPEDATRGIRDAAEVRWKYAAQPVTGSDYDGRLVFTDANPETRTLSFPFSSEELCGDDSLYIWLVDSSGNFNTENFNQARYRFDICAPKIERVHADSNDIAILGGVFRDTLKITDHVGVDTAWAIYRFGGAEAEEPPRPLTQIDNTDLYAIEIPVAGVTRRGIEVRAVALDSLQNRGYAPDEYCGDGMDDDDDENIFFPIRTRIEGEGDFRVDADGRPVALIAGADSTNYQLFSIPYALDSSDVMTVLKDDLGTYDKTMWRLFDYNPSAAAGERFLEGAAARAFAPGRSFFIISRQENIVVDSGPGVTTATACYDSIQVYDGWNLIASPFNFPVHRESLSLLNSETTISLRSFERGWNIVDVMDAWKGYALFVSKPAEQSSETKMYLLVEPKAAPGRVSKVNGFVTNSPDDWRVRIAASSGSLHDRDNWVGIKSGADVNYDRFELAEPPVIGNYLKVSFPRPEWNLAAAEFSTDFRPVGDDQQVWQFEVSTNRSGANVDLDFEFLGALPVNSEIFLIDEALQQSLNLQASKHYRFKAGKAGSRKLLKLIVGSTEFAQEQAGDFGLTPAEFALLPNFPNPFNPETSIRYNLPEAGAVTLEIFDLLGRRVSTLVDRRNHAAGFHNTTWNGRDAHGQPVASGVYIYRLRSNNNLSVVRKMILMK